MNKRQKKKFLCKKSQKNYPTKYQKCLAIKLIDKLDNTNETVLDPMLYDIASVLHYNRTKNKRDSIFVVANYLRSAKRYFEWGE